MLNIESRPTQNENQKYCVYSQVPINEVVIATKLNLSITFISESLFVKKIMLLEF